jgi:hypothetical protein
MSDIPYYEKHTSAVVRQRKPWAKRPPGAPPRGVYLYPSTVVAEAAGPVDRLLVRFSPSIDPAKPPTFELAPDSAQVGVKLVKHDLIATSDPIGPLGDHRLEILITPGGTGEPAPSPLPAPEPVTFKQPIRLKLT